MNPTDQARKYKLKIRLSFVIVIVNSRFLERPQKRSRRNPLIHSRLTKTKSIGTGQDPKSQAGYVVWCLELSRGGRIGEKMNRDRIC